MIGICPKRLGSVAGVFMEPTKEVEISGLRLIGVQGHKSSAEEVRLDTVIHIMNGTMFH